jgi:ferrochelatase
MSRIMIQVSNAELQNRKKSLKTQPISIIETIFTAYNIVPIRSKIAWTGRKNSRDLSSGVCRMLINNNGENTMNMKVILSAAAVVLGVSHTALASEKRIGVLLSSYGDVDSPEEVKDYLKSAIRDPDVSPIPGFLKGVAAELAWAFGGKDAADEYRVIGGSNYRATSRAQADRVADELRQLGVEVKTYTGFVFTYPFIKDTMRAIQADGITDLLVFNQGAQYSKVTQGINIREVRTYLKKHREYRPNVTAVRSFSDDPRFRDLLADSIQTGLTENFPKTNPSDVCIYLPAHGLPQYLPDNNDPAYGQMLRAYDDMKARFQGHLVVTGFQNHSELGSKWTMPDSDEQAHFLAASANCQNVLINGRISFTVDNIETLFDEGVSQRQTILEARPNTNVVVQKSFNTESSFTKLLADLTVEALAGKGDLEKIVGE